MMIAQHGIDYRPVVFSPKLSWPARLPGSAIPRFGLGGTRRELRALTSSFRRAGLGFTLIEILIVVSIIAVVAGLVVMGIQRARQRVNITAAKLMVNSISNAIENYYQDESVYPGMELTPSPDENHFPALYNALQGEKKPHGPGGRNAPYMQVKEEQTAVYDADLDQYLPATLEQIRDPSTDKYILDPWGNPYIYRCNKGKKLERYMRNPSYDIYSMGPNGEDDTVKAGGGDAGNSDDIGNW